MEEISDMEMFKDFPTNTKKISHNAQQFGFVFE